VLRPFAARARSGQTRARRTLAAAGAANTGAMLLAMSSLLDSSLRKELYRGPLADVRGDAALASIAAAGGAQRFRDPLAGLLYLDAQLALPEDFLLYFDRASMARSLEVRVPFLDHELVEWAARIPTRVKVRRLETKLVLKQAARGILPDSVIDKRKIGFFRAASHAWLVSQLRGELGERLVGPESPTADLLDVTTIKRLVDQQLSGDRSRTQLVIAIAMLELWLSSLHRSRTGATPVSR
jgi:asparagine synthase (glutamine-hydrolysing)